MGQAGPACGVRPEQPVRRWGSNYFMMADEIEIDTCLFLRDGQLAERLHVSIGGPGALFRIEPVGPGKESGTRVRLYLTAAAAPLPCTIEVKSWLKVAEFGHRGRRGRETHGVGAGNYRQVSGMSRLPGSRALPAGGVPCGGFTNNGALLGRRHPNA